MKIRYVRSPYIIDIDEPTQIGSKLELFIWNKGQTAPTTPTYNFSKNIMSTTQTAHSYNVANYIREYITNIVPNLQGSTPTQEDNAMWCYFMVKRYILVGSTYTLLTSDSQLDMVTQIAVNGFTDYMGGRNQESNASPKFLFNTDIKLNYVASISQTPYYVNMLTDQVNQLHTITYKNKSGTTLSTSTFTPTEVSNYKINVGLFGLDTYSVTVDVAEPTTTTTTSTTTIPGTTTTTTTTTSTTTAAPTTTTTAAPLCFSYVYGPGYTSGTIYWTNCNGSPGSAYVAAGGYYTIPCARQGSGSGFGGFTPGSAC